LVYAGVAFIRMRRRIITLLLVAIAANSAAADYPLRPLRMIKPNAAGSANDTPNRLVVKAARLKVE